MAHGPLPSQPLIKCMQIENIHCNDFIGLNRVSVTPPKQLSGFDEILREDWASSVNVHEEIYM